MSVEYLFKKPEVNCSMGKCLVYTYCEDKSRNLDVSGQTEDLIRDSLSAKITALEDEVIATRKDYIKHRSDQIKYHADDYLALTEALDNLELAEQHDLKVLADTIEKTHRFHSAKLQELQDATIAREAVLVASKRGCFGPEVESTASSVPRISCSLADEEAMIKAADLLAKAYSTY